MAGKPELVGIQEIAAMLGVAAMTPVEWRRRGKLPEPEWVISARPIWLRETIVEWARATGRWDEERMAG